MRYTASHVGNPLKSYPRFGSSFERAFLLFFALCLLTGAAGADPRDEATRWRPSVAIQVSVGIRDFDSQTSSTLIMGPPLPDSPVEQDSNHGPITVAAPASGSATNVSPIISGVFELMSPRLFENAGQPRFFAHAAVDADRGSSRDLAKVGVAGELRKNPEDLLMLATLLKRRSRTGRSPIHSDKACWVYGWRRHRLHTRHSGKPNSNQTLRRIDFDARSLLEFDCSRCRPEPE